jgi:hypothetical protein
MSTIPSSLEPIRDVMTSIRASGIFRRADGAIMVQVYGRGALAPTPTPADDQTADIVRWLDRQRRLWWVGARPHGESYPRLTKAGERLRARWSRCWPDDRDKAVTAHVAKSLRSIGAMPAEPVLGLRRTPLDDEGQALAKPAARRRGSHRAA